MNKDEHIKMWENAAAMYDSQGAKAVGGFENNASKQKRPLTSQEKAAAIKHAQNKAAADKKIADNRRNKGN